MVEWSEDEHARFWEELNQQAAEARAMIETMTASAESDLAALLAELEAESSLADMLATLKEDTEHVSNYPAQPEHKPRPRPPGRNHGRRRTTRPDQGRRAHD